MDIVKKIAGLLLVMCFVNTTQSMNIQPAVDETAKGFLTKVISAKAYLDYVANKFDEEYKLRAIRIGDPNQYNRLLADLADRVTRVKRIKGTHDERFYYRMINGTEAFVKDKIDTYFNIVQGGIVRDDRVS